VGGDGAPVRPEREVGQRDGEVPPLGLHAPPNGLLERLDGGRHVRALRGRHPYLPVLVTHSVTELAGQLLGDLVGELARHPARRDQTQHDRTVAASLTGHATPSTHPARLIRRVHISPADSPLRASALPRER
jgi:hypothetical protein